MKQWNPSFPGKTGKGLKQTFLQRRQANNHMKRYSVNMTQQRCKIKTTMRHHLTPNGMAIIKGKKWKITSDVEDAEKSEFMCPVGRNVKWCQASVENSMEVSPKIKHGTTVWSSSPTPGTNLIQNRTLQIYWYCHGHCCLIHNSHELLKLSSIDSVRVCYHNSVTVKNAWMIECCTQKESKIIPSLSGFSVFETETKVKLPTWFCGSFSVPRHWQGLREKLPVGPLIGSYPLIHDGRADPEGTEGRGRV